MLVIQTLRRHRNLSRDFFVNWTRLAHRATVSTDKYEHVISYVTATGFDPTIT